MLWLIYKTGHILYNIMVYSHFSHILYIMSFKYNQFPQYLIYCAQYCISSQQGLLEFPCFALQ